MAQCEYPDLVILYVEDDQVTRMELEQLLKRRAGTVLVADNGSAGLELFRRQPADLVITDIRMPIMDGIRMAQLIREIDPGVRIIATTAHSDASYLMEAIEAGIDHYVLKPLDLGKFFAAIDKCSQDIRARHALARHHAEREKLIAELQAALDEITTLREILPICSYCKDIRNDEGYWERVDAYISRHTNVDFSHSICPACMKKHYPEHYESVMARINRPDPKKTSPEKG
jgi:YesN/AraC family two-component response regulator